MITLIGDTHGFEFDKIKNNIESDYIIVLGDFGFKGKNLIKLNNMLKKSNCILLFVDGNHEWYNKLKKCKTIDMFNGKVDKYSEKIFRLRRGEVYTIENKIFLTFGGAKSIDKVYKIAENSWFQEEEYNNEEYNKLYNNIIKYNYEFDYILSHDGPYEIVKQIYIRDIEPSKTSYLLDNIRKNCKFKNWYFGHHHMDKQILNFKCLYDTYEKIY